MLRKPIQPGHPCRVPTLRGSLRGTCPAYSHFLNGLDGGTIALYNLRADMANKPAPLLNPATLQPMTAAELEGVFCKELVAQELDDHTPYWARIFRPTSVVSEGEGVTDAP